MTLKQLDMKNQTSPFSEIRTVKTIPLVYNPIKEDNEASFLYHAKYFFQPAEFEDKTDLIGLFDEDVSPEKFFIDVSIEGQSYFVDTGKMKGVAHSWIQLYISDKKHIYERQKYSILMLVSDFGGFQGALIIIPSSFMSLYAASMLAKSLTAQLPVILKHPQKSNPIAKA